MKRGFPILAIVTALLLSFGLYEALIGAPTERTMGDVQRIFYYHVPSAWTAFLLFLINFLASVQFLVRSSESTERLANRLTLIIFLVVFAAGGAFWSMGAITVVSIYATCFAIYGIYFLIGKYFAQSTTDILALVTAEVGVVFCTVVLVTGPIWARPVWGIWWTWDLRLTLTLVLWLIYVSYLMLRRFSTSSQTPVLAAVLAIFGALDVPLVYFSIWFFRTQHPSPVIGDGGSLDTRMLHVLLINWAAFLCLAWLVCWTRYRLEVVQREIDEAQSLESLLEGDGSR
jgi:heme exporter protein C